MIEKDIQNYLKRIVEMEKPVHMKEMGQQLNISGPTASKLLSILEERGAVKTKRLGNSWVIYGVSEKQHEEVGPTPGGA